LECDEFYSLGAEQVAQLIASDTITVPSEERVFECVIAWIHHDVETR
jgi:kelch-like protein 2/3